MYKWEIWHRFDCAERPDYAAHIVGACREKTVRTIKCLITAQHHYKFASSQAAQRPDPRAAPGSCSAKSSWCHRTETRNREIRRMPHRCVPNLYTDIYLLLTYTPTSTCWLCPSGARVHCALRRFCHTAVAPIEGPIPVASCASGLVQALMQRCFLHLPQFKLLASRRFSFPAVYTQSSPLSRYSRYDAIVWRKKKSLFYFRIMMALKLKFALFITVANKHS
jgi:hypothetical protein